MSAPINAIDEQLAAAIVALLSLDTYTQGGAEHEWVTEFEVEQVWVAKTAPKECPTPKVQVAQRSRKAEAVDREDDMETIEVDIGLACHVVATDTARISELNRLAEQLADAVRSAGVISSLDATHTGYTRPALWDQVMLSQKSVFLTCITTSWDVIRAI